MGALDLTLSRWVKARIKETDQKQGGKCPAGLKCIYSILMGRQKWSSNDKICLAAVWAYVHSFTNCCKLNFSDFQLFLSVLVIYRQLRVSESCLLTFMALILMLCIPSFHCCLEIFFDSGLRDAVN